MHAEDMHEMQSMCRVVHALCGQEQRPTHLFHLSVGFQSSAVRQDWDMVDAHTGARRCPLDDTDRGKHNLK